MFDPVGLLIYLLIAALVGLIAERLVGTGVFGLVGNVLVGLAGIWVMLNLLHWYFPGDLNIGGVPIITAKPNLAEEFAGLIDLEQADVWLADADAPAEIIAEAVLRHREYRLPDQRRGISPNWSTIAEQHLQFYEQLIRQ